MLVIVMVVSTIAMVMRIIKIVSAVLFWGASCRRLGTGRTSIGRGARGDGGWCASGGATFGHGWCDAPKVLKRLTWLGEIVRPTAREARAGSRLLVVRPLRCAPSRNAERPRAVRATVGL